MNDCLFCRIVAGEIPSSKVYEDDTVYAFRDINPMAPVHILIVPKAHLTSAADITADNAALVAHIFAVIPQIAAAEGLTANLFITGALCASDMLSMFGKNYIKDENFVKNKHLNRHIPHDSGA